MDLDSFLAKCIVWYFQVSPLSKITPKNLVCVTTSIFLPSIIVVIEFSVLLAFLPKIIMWVFDKLRDSRLVCSQEVRRGISQLIFSSNWGSDFPLARRFESSAKRTVLKFLKIFPRSFI